MAWIALAIFAITIVAVITNVIDGAVAALVGVAAMIWVGVMTEEHARLAEQAAAQYLAVIEKAARAAGVPCTCEHVTSVFFIPLAHLPCHSEPKARNLQRSKPPRSLARAARGLGMTSGARRAASG
jgi:hypothetical protein